jgi:hypothetical protein
MEQFENRPRKVMRVPVKKIIGGILLLMVLFFVFFSITSNYDSHSSSQNLLIFIRYLIPVFFLLSILTIIYGLMVEGKRSFIMFGIGCVIIVGLLYMASGMFFNTFGNLGSSSSRMISRSELPRIPTTGGYPAPDYGYGQADITDTREFLKINYSASIESRDVSKTVKDVKGAVREAEGRIDGENISEKSGYISFVVPKSRFDAFRDEVESITHRKLYTENVSSQNLLNQKQDIEQQMGMATSSLAALEQQKSNLDAQHAQTLGAMTRELENIQRELDTVRENMQFTTDESAQASLQNQENALINRQATVRQNRDNENRNYSSRNQNLVSSINAAKNNVGYVEKQDDQFENNIETVSGHVSVSWISFWGLLVIFSPLHPFFVFVIIIGLVWWYLKRKGYMPTVEFV